jgi:hypothetical protein
VSRRAGGGSALPTLLLSCSADGVRVYDAPPSAALLRPPVGSGADEGTVVAFDGLVEASQDDPSAPS